MPPQGNENKDQISNLAMKYTGGGGFTGYKEEYTGYWSKAAFREMQCAGDSKASYIRTGFS
ncbi:MAG: hypothetical protein ACTHLD_10500 [Chitinophaga sp.]